MCIVHSTLRVATTPYTERWHSLKSNYRERKKAILPK